MKHIKDNLVPASIFVLAVTPPRLVGASDKYLAAEVYIRFARNTLSTLALILPVTCGVGISFAIAVGAISAQIAMVSSVDLRLEGAVALMFVIGASIMLSVLFGMVVAALLNRARGREMIVSIMIRQLSLAIYQFIFTVAYRLLTQPRNRDVLPDRGIGVRSMVDARNISSVSKGILPFRFGGKIYSLFPLVIVLFSSPVLFYTQKTRPGALARAVGTDGRTAGTLGIAGNRVRSIRVVISTIFAAMNQILFVADLGITNAYTGHLGLDTFMAAAILVGGASIKKARMGNCFIGVILFHALFITSPMAGQNLFHNPSMGEHFRSSLAYGVIVTAIIMNPRNERIKVQGVQCSIGAICLHT